MAKLLAVLFVSCFGFITVGGSYVAFQQDNLRTRFRDDPSVFNKAWDMPVSMSGKNWTADVQTDLVLYGDGRLVDYLFPFAWEREWVGAGTSVVTRTWWWVSYAVVSLYYIGLCMGGNFMKDRKPYGLKNVLALWNLFLAIFSFIGAVRTVPHLVMMVTTYGFDYTLCRAAVAGYGNGAVGFWVAAFVYSKYVELIDTVFLVIRKRKVGFLHWYHHCSVLLYCWHAYVWEMPTGIYFVAMNYTVHAIMYFYYFLAAVCTRPLKWALLVTILQLLQMAVGIAVTISHLRILLFDTLPRCDGHIPNLTGALGMYASYFILFAHFLVERYCQKREVRKPKKLE